MQLSDLLTVDRIACNVGAASKKRVLEQLSELIVSAPETTLSQMEIFDSLIARERLGSTGLGHGVAIPHGRVKASDKTVGAFIKLESGVDYDAVDQQPVDLLFGLLVPEHSTEEHLQLLASMAEMFSDSGFLNRLRAAESPGEILALLESRQGGS